MSVRCTRLSVPRNKTRGLARSQHSTWRNVGNSIDGSFALLPEIDRPKYLVVQCARTRSVPGIDGHTSNPHPLFLSFTPFPIVSFSFPPLSLFLFSSHFSLALQSFLFSWLSIYFIYLPLTISSFLSLTLIIVFISFLLFFSYLFIFLFFKRCLFLFLFFYVLSFLLSFFYILHLSLFHFILVGFHFLFSLSLFHCLLLSNERSSESSLPRFSSGNTFTNRMHVATTDIEDGPSEFLLRSIDQRPDRTRALLPLPPTDNSVRSTCQTLFDTARFKSNFLSIREICTALLYLSFEKGFGVVSW